MGGIGSGGQRVGTGSKPKSRADKVLEGTAKRGQKPATLPNVDEFDAPDCLTHDERAVWLDLAPHAFQARTLTRATAYSFQLMCRNIVLERALASEPEERGKANHRGVIQRIDAELLRFSLSPIGKPMASVEPEKKDEWTEFDGAETVQ